MMLLVPGPPSRGWLDSAALACLLSAVVVAGACLDGAGENPPGRGGDVSAGGIDGEGAVQGDGGGDGGGAGNGTGEGPANEGEDEGGVGSGTAEGGGAGDGGADDANEAPPDEGGDEGQAGEGVDGDEGGGGGEGGEGGGGGEGGVEGAQGGGEGPDCEPIGDRELCGTGVDEDCDGQIDEGFEIDDPCEAGRGACHRVGEWVCTIDGRGLFCDVEPGRPTAELCGNGIDEDCDGEADERFVVGQQCEVGLGGCSALGEWECSADRRGVVCSAQRGDGRLELCDDDLDNDCDGEIDEADWIGGACSVGVGVCQRAGAWECGPDGGSACSAQPGAPGEPGGEVTCDGRDNDCDGVTDEFPAGGGPCERGLGVCHREGMFVCQANGAEVCSVRAGDPQENLETRCDGLDNDCDGEVDEEMGLGRPCQGGVGACRVQGVTACNGQGGIGCSVRPPEAPEPGIERTCDGEDGDCDGEVDEGCDDDEDGRCDADMRVVGRPAICPDSPAGQGDDCDDETADRRPGLRDGCDGVDQDCDGEVDEAGEANGAACVPPFVGALARSQGRWGYGGEVGVEGARAACRVLAAHSALCDRDDVVEASGAGELAGAIGEDGQAVTSFWVDSPDGARCVREGGGPWTENDPEADTTGHVIFINNGTGAIVSERDTICSVPRHVACCGWQ